MHLNEFLFPATERDIEILLLQMKEYSYLESKLMTPIEDNPQYEYININFQNSRKRSLLFIIKYICRSKNYKAYFVKCEHRNDEITGFVSYLNKDRILKDLIVLTFEYEESREKALLIHYLYSLFTMELKKQSKITIEICKNDSKTDYYCKKAAEFSHFYYKHVYNEESDRWNYVISEKRI